MEGEWERSPHSLQTWWLQVAAVKRHIDAVKAVIETGGLDDVVRIPLWSGLGGPTLLRDIAMAPRAAWDTVVAALRVTPAGDGAVATHRAN